MGEDMRELLHEAAPRPVREPDFARMWARGRRQRRLTRLAGVTGVVVLLIVGGVGLTQLAMPGPGDVQVADEPNVHEPLRGRGQDFGEAETPDGVPYGGRIRVDEAAADDDGGTGRERHEVCVSVSLGPRGERTVAEGCGLLERYLSGETLLTSSRGSSHAAVAGWSPLETDRAVWELPDGGLPIEVLEAPGDLPGSVFVIAADDPPAEGTVIVLYDSAGEEVDRLVLASDGSFGEGDPTGPDGGTVPVSDRWMTPDDREVTEQELGEGTWIVGYFFPTDADRAGPDFSDALEPHWLRISDDTRDLDRRDQLREALTALAGPPPTHMADAWQGPELRLELGTAQLDGNELVLDFEQLHAQADGSSQAMAMQAQFEQVAFHYYPEADAICVLEDGEPAVWLHDMPGCPSRGLPQ